MATMVDLALDEIEVTVDAALRRHGASEYTAHHVAHAVRVAEGNGNKICGLYYVESYCTQMVAGRVDGTVVPRVSVECGAVRVDAGLGFAQPAFAVGFDAAVDAARTNGICGYSIERAHTCTSLGYFTEQLACAGLLAIGATNSPAHVAPPGGSTPVLGTNPIAMAVPDGHGGVAFQFDFSTSAVALGKITMAAEAGEPIPLGWAVDAHGKPTTDPRAALGGSLLSAGDYKGFGIGLMVELLASALTGGRLSVDTPPMKTPDGPPHRLGQFYIVIDPDAFSGAEFHEHVAALIGSIASQPGARVPGADRHVPTSVDIDDAVWASIVALAESA